MLHPDAKWVDHPPHDDPQRVFHLRSLRTHERSFSKQKLALVRPYFRKSIQRYSPPHFTKKKRNKSKKETK